MTYKSTPTVCAELGMTPAALNSWLSRHERYKPKRRDQSGFQWTPEEVEQVRRARATALPYRRNSAQASSNQQ